MIFCVLALRLLLKYSLIFYCLLSIQFHYRHQTIIRQIKTGIPDAFIHHFLLCSTSKILQPVPFIFHPDQRMLNTGMTQLGFIHSDSRRPCRCPEWFLELIRSRWTE